MDRLVNLTTWIMVRLGYTHCTQCGKLTTWRRETDSGPAVPVCHSGICYALSVYAAPRVGGVRGQ